MVGERRMFAGFAIPTNMLANILTNILSLERLSECFFFQFRMFSFHDKNIYLMVPKEKTLILKWLKIKIKKDLVDHKKKIRWDNEMVDKLIDLYEARPCLWDIADPTYSKRNVKEKALSEIKEQLGMEKTAIKAKWNSLRAQHRRELAKENKTKSGQSADDLYESSWQYM